MKSITLTDEAYQRGLALFRDYIKEHPDDPWLLEESMTLFVALKPE